MFFWKFKIMCWASDIGEFVHEGLTYGATFTEAMESLESWYGDEIMEVYLECITEDGEPYVLNEEIKGDT